MKFLKNLYQTILNTPKDKILHFIVGFAIGIVSMLIASILYSYGFISLEPYKYSLLALSLIGAGKEFIYDLLLKRGTPEIADAIATFLGGFLSIYLIEMIF